MCEFGYLENTDLTPFGLVLKAILRERAVENLAELCRLAERRGYSLDEGVLFRAVYRGDDPEHTVDLLAGIDATLDLEVGERLELEYALEWGRA